MRKLSHHITRRSRSAQGALRTSPLAGAALGTTRGATAAATIAATAAGKTRNSALSALWAEEEGGNGVPDATAGAAAEVAVEKSSLPFFLDPSTR